MPLLTPVRRNESDPILQQKRLLQPLHSYRGSRALIDSCFGSTRKKGSRAHIGEMKPYVRGRDVAVVDAYAAVMRVCGEGFQTCSLQHEHDVHPSGPGKMFLALEVAAAVAPLLGPAK